MNNNLEDIKKSFNKMKNTLYTNTYDIKKYEYTDITSIITKEHKTEEDWKVLEKFYHFITNIKNVVEDLGTEIINVKNLDFNNKNEIELFSRSMIELIDKFIDTLVAINEHFSFKNDDINTRMSEYKLKSLRTKFVQKINKYRIQFDVNADKSEVDKIRVLISDILDDIIKETVSLRIKKLHEVLSRQFEDK